MKNLRLPWRRLRIAFCLLFVFLAIDSFLIEPYWLQTSSLDLKVYGLSEPARLLLLSDLHLNGDAGFRERWILKRIGGWKVDAVFVAGDVFDAAAGMNPAVHFLRGLAKQASVYVVLGNWEHWSGANLAEYRRELSASGIHLLENSARTLALRSKKLSVIGVGDLLNKQDQLSTALLQAEFPAILLSHEPVIFNSAAEKNVRLVLAGHTHGGQVTLPLWGPLWLPPGCKPYVHGVYSQAASRMVVTKGVGTSVLPVRFYCRPEVVLLNLS